MYVADGIAAASGAAAGTGGTAVVQGTTADCMRGLLGITTGTAGMVAGILAIVTLPTPILADADAFGAAAATMPNVAAVGGAFAAVDLSITLYTLPPAGVVFQPVANLQAGQMTRFAVVVSGALPASTVYRMSWRIRT